MLNDLLSKWPYNLLTPLVLFSVLTAFMLPNHYIYHQDENYYMNSTRSMWANGEFLVPTYNDTPRINKPIGFYWLMLAPQGLLGHGFASSRLVSWAFAVAMLVLAYGAAGLVFADPQRRSLVVWTLASMDAFYRYAHYAVPEMTLTFFMACAHLAAWRWLASKRRADLAWMYVFCGLAFNIKGPVGVILPFAATALFLVFNQRRQEMVHLFSLLGAVLLLTITAPWYIALSAELGVERMLVMMGKETAGRVFSLVNSPFYYLPVLLLYFAPWTWFPLVHLRHWLKGDARRGFFASLKQSYPFVWFITYMVFYSMIVGEKHQWYALQCSLPLALLCVKTLMPNKEARPFHRTYLFLGVATGSITAVGLYLALALGDILISTSAMALLFGSIGFGILNIGLTREPAARIRAVAFWAMVIHFLFFQAVLPSTQLRPATKFAAPLQQHERPFELLINERYFHKKLFLFDIPNLTASELEKHSNLFEAKLREQLHEFALCRKSVFDEMDLSIQNAYEIISTGYSKKEKETERLPDSPLARWLRFLTTWDETQVVEPVYLLQRNSKTQ